MDEDLNEADLVARAAEAHGDPLILPDRRIIADSKPAPTEAPRKLEQFKPVDEHKVKQSLDKIEVKSRGEDHDLLIPKDKVVEPIITKQVIAPAAPPPPPSPFGAGAPPPPPLPTGRPLQPGKMAPPPPPPPMGKPFGAPKPLPTKPVPAKLPPVPLAGAPHKTSASLLAGIGLLVAILVLGGGGYVLALTGTRLPLFGTMVSGLPGNVVQATNAGTAFVDAHAPYRFTGASDITLADEKSKTLADGTPAVFKLHTEYKGGLITDKGARFLNSATVSANDGAAVPISLRDTGNEYLAAFPANTDTTPATLVDTNLDDTLLAPSLHPIPVEVVLKAVQTERSYQKVVIGQKPAGSYNVTLDPAQLKDYFPTGSTVENPLAIVALAWKGAGVSAGQPLDVQVSTSFTYMERKYQFTAHWVYDGWGETTAAPAELGTLAATDPGNVNTDLTSESFVSRLGIAFKALPHGTSATSGAPTDDTTRFTPVIPSGDVIEVVQTARAENPPVPSQPATTEGKQRDAQRKQDLQDIQKALEQYKLEKGSYPTSGGETQLGTDPTLFGDLVPNYLTKMPVDPLNSTYYYAYNVITDSSGNVTGYYLRAVLEDHSDPSATVGQVYHYYQLTNK